ncbi:hypothetical protein C7G83_20730, partial [Siccibacter turicensis]
MSTRSGAVDAADNFVVPWCSAGRLCQCAQHVGPASHRNRRTSGAVESAQKKKKAAFIVRQPLCPPGLCNVHIVSSHQDAHSTNSLAPLRN